MNGKVIYPNLSYNIIGIAMEVHRRLGSGFLEKLYENALMILFQKNGINVQTQVPYEVEFENQIIGNYFADIVIENKIVLEIKAVKRILDLHKAQTINYLKASGLKLGIILNFGEGKLTSERVINLKTNENNKEYSSNA